MSRREMKLGEILVADGAITPWQREMALGIQQRTKQFLGEIMIEKEWITDDQLARVLSEQFDIPLEPRMPEDVDWSVADHYVSVASEQGLSFPIKQDADHLWVAISNPLDAWTVSEIEKQARGKEVRLVLATAKRIKQMSKELKLRKAQEDRSSE